MKSAQVEVDIRNEQSMVFASHRTTAIGLGLTALGVFIRGSKISPDTSGNYHLDTGRPLSRRSRTSPLGVFDWHTTGRLHLNRCVTTHETGYRLNHPEDVGG